MALHLQQEVRAHDRADRAANSLPLLAPFLLLAARQAAFVETVTGDTYKQQANLLDKSVRTPLTACIGARTGMVIDMTIQNGPSHRPDAIQQAARSCRQSDAGGPEHTEGPGQPDLTSYAPMTPAPPAP